MNEWAATVVVVAAAHNRTMHRRRRHRRSRRQKLHRNEHLVSESHSEMTRGSASDSNRIDPNNGKTTQFKC